MQVRSKSAELDMLACAFGENWAVVWELYLRYPNRNIFITIGFGSCGSKKYLLGNNPDKKKKKKLPLPFKSGLPGVQLHCREAIEEDHHSLTLPREVEQGLSTETLPPKSRSLSSRRVVHARSCTQVEDCHTSFSNGLWEQSSDVGFHRWQMLRQI